MSVSDIAPCKDCKDRYLGCHDRCPKYLSFKEKVNEVKKKRSKYYASLTPYSTKTISKFIKLRGQK